ncbi:MAG: transcription antitermination factor NusB [Bacteroidales bacterium]|nr:transcription antitermination factor NusB [Bacteroidales bacterium]
MLSRRHLRIKVVQALYAFFQSKNDRLDLGEKQLILSVNKLYELYIYQLSFLVAVQQFAVKRIEDAKKKHLPTNEDINPNSKFINNRIFKQLASNKDFLKKEEIFKISWIDEKEMIRKFFLEFKDNYEYINYLNSDEDSYEDDKKIIIKLVKKYLSSFTYLESYFEDKNIYWVDDFHTANFLVLKTIKSFTEDQDEFKLLPGIYKSSNNNNEHKDFIISLFRKTIIKSEEYTKMIEEKVKNWEFERIAIMDVILLKMALAELLEFPSIPVKVTMNEYIELAKYFSTSKSSVFINGVLDKIILSFNNENMIKKTGRGLMT